MSVILVLGGARSGKSHFAESQCKKPRSYIATAQAFDDEMKQRILQHQHDRGGDWTTIEAPLDLVGALKTAKGAILLDCLTLWLNNVMMAEKDAKPEIAELCTYLEHSKQNIVVVSNELGLGIVPDNRLTRQFRDLHGLMNRQVAAVADCVVFMVAGIPQVIKGRLPEGRRQSPKSRRPLRKGQGLR